MNDSLIYNKTKEKTMSFVSYLVNRNPVYEYMQHIFVSCFSNDKQQQLNDRNKRLNKTIIRDTKPVLATTCWFWTFVGFILVVSFINFIILISVLCVARGRFHMLFDSENDLFMFTSNTGFKSILQKRNLYQSFVDVPMTMSVGKEGLAVKTHDRFNRPIDRLAVNSNVTFFSTDHFCVKDLTGEKILNFEQELFKNKVDISTLDIKSFKTSNINSLKKNLGVKSDKVVRIDGGTGTSINTGNVDIEADGDIVFRSPNKDIVFVNRNLYLKNIPLISHPIYKTKVHDKPYTICVCPDKTVYGVQSYDLPLGSSVCSFIDPSTTDYPCKKTRQ